VRRFVYASSSSVYGVSDKPDVTEDHPLVPLTLYNKYKGMCEPLLKKHTDATFTGVIFRPATVCGTRAATAGSVGQHPDQSRRQSWQDYRIRRVSVAAEPAHPGLIAMQCSCFSPRPPTRYRNEIFNVGYQNLSLMQIAELVRRVVAEEMPERKAVDIVTTPTDDVRSFISTPIR